MAVAETLQVGAALQHQVFQVRRQPEMRDGENRVGSLAGILEHRIAWIVDEINVVAGSAVHRVRSGTAVQDVVSGIAIDRVGLAIAVGLKIGAALRRFSTLADSRK